jgi:hypothetical protein
MVVLSASLQVLHMNRRAMDLLARLVQAPPQIGTASALAKPLHQHCQDIIETMSERHASNNWEQFHQSRTIGDSSHRIFLKGFGLPDRRGLSHSRIVILLSPHDLSSIPGSSRRESSSLVVHGLSGLFGLSCFFV